MRRCHLEKFVTGRKTLTHLPDLRLILIWPQIAPYVSIPPITFSALFFFVNIIHHKKFWLFIKPTPLWEAIAPKHPHWQPTDGHFKSLFTETKRTNYQNLLIKGFDSFAHRLSDYDGMLQLNLYNKDYVSTVSAHTLWLAEISIILTNRCRPRL